MKEWLWFWPQIKNKGKINQRAKIMIHLNIYSLTHNKGVWVSGKNEWKMLHVTSGLHLEPSSWRAWLFAVEPDINRSAWSNGSQWDVGMIFRWDLMSFSNNFERFDHWKSLMDSKLKTPSAKDCIIALGLSVNDPFRCAQFSLIFWSATLIGLWLDQINQNPVISQLIDNLGESIVDLIVSLKRRAESHSQFVWAMGFTYAAFAYIVALILDAFLIFFAVFHVSSSILSLMDCLDSPGAFSWPID